MSYEVLKCPNCGAPFLSEQNFCDHCGVGLREKKDGEKTTQKETASDKVKNFFNGLTGSVNGKMCHRDIAMILAGISLVIGGIQLHKIYLKNIKSFILSLIFCWTSIPFILCIFDIIKYDSYTPEQFKNKYFPDKNT